MDLDFHKLLEGAISWSAVGAVFISYSCLLFTIIPHIFCMSVQLAEAICIRWKITVQYYFCNKAVVSKGVQNPKCGSLEGLTFVCSVIKEGSWIFTFMFKSLIEHLVVVLI
jgi:hypothetical protein